MSEVFTADDNYGTPVAGRSRRPLIGISCYCEQARWRNWDLPAMVLPRRYADLVADSGGIPVLLPPLAGVEDGLHRFDGLVLSGGGDIDPAYYQAERAPATGGISAQRDKSEIALFSTAMSMDLPVLGICRGLQLINVAQGGTLHQHLPDLVGHDEHSPTPGSYGMHEITATPGSMLAKILGDVHQTVAVPTHHHQAVDKVGRGLSPTAWAVDGTVEALEMNPGEHSFVMAVQWHPEAGGDTSLFRALAVAAADRSSKAALRS